MSRIAFAVALTTAVVLPFNSFGGKKIIVPDNYRVIQVAIEKAEPGDTVFVKKGIYKENIILRDDIALIGESYNGTVIHGNGRSPVVKTADGCLIRNLTIENGAKGIISENTVSVIEHTLIRNNKGTGIHCLISLPAIRNNLIYRNKETGIYCESVRSIKTEIEHNVISENGYSGIMLAGRSEVLVENNVIFNNKQYGIWVGEDSRRSRIVFNDFYGNRTQYNYYAQVDKSNIAEDPAYPLLEPSLFDYTAEPVSLKGKGRDGATIGLISQDELSRRITDPDGDGVQGADDKCPSIAEDIDGFEDQDGCPDFDNDNDGLYDTQDRCPGEPEDMDSYIDDDGCPDADNDRDGILDKDDKCPMNPETVNGYKDDDGCPDEAPKNEALKGKAAKTEDAMDTAKVAPQTAPAQPAPAAPAPAIPAKQSGTKAPVGQTTAVQPVTPASVQTVPATGSKNQPAAVQSTTPKVNTVPDSMSAKVTKKADKTVPATAK